MMLFNMLFSLLLNIPSCLFKTFLLTYNNTIFQNMVCAPLLDPNNFTLTSSFAALTQVQCKNVLKTTKF